MKNSRFILLHLQRDNSPAIVNVDCIEQIYTSSETKCTVIVFETNDDDMPVRESVEKIYNMIENLSVNKENTKVKKQLNS